MGTDFKVTFALSPSKVATRSPDDPTYSRRVGVEKAVPAVIANALLAEPGALFDVGMVYPCVIVMAVFSIEK